MRNKAAVMLMAGLSAAFCAIALLFGASRHFGAIADGEIIEHYEGVAPTLNSPGKAEHWASCLTHKRWTDENREFEVSDEELIIAQKTSGTLLEEENLRQMELLTIDPASFENVDQTAPTYYSIDSREAIYFSNSIKKDGYSKFTFRLSTPLTPAMGFDYKMYDLNADRLQKNGLLFSKGNYSRKIGKACSFVEIRSGGECRYVEKDLRADNNWHTMLAKFRDNIQIDEISIYIKNFVGEIYISDLSVNATKMTIRSNGTNANGIYLNTPSDNGVPSPAGSTWNYLSSQTMVGAVLKNNQGFAQTSSKMLFKLTTTTYYLALSDNSQSAALNDIIQLNGIFRYVAEGRIYSYILLSPKMIYDGSTFVNYATLIEGYAVGQNGNGGQLGFYLNNSASSATSLPTSGWSGSAFKPTQDDCLILDGRNYGANNPTRDTFLKLTDGGSFYMALDRQNANVALEGSVVEVDGAYRYDGGETAINIEFNSLVLVYSNGKWSFYDFDYHMNGKGAGRGESETAGVTGGVYFSLEKNAMAHSTNGSNVWNTYRLKPSSSGNIRLLRDGVSHDIGDANLAPMDKYGANGTYYYLEFSKTAYSSYGGPTGGDVLVIGGSFICPLSGLTYTLTIEGFYAYFTGTKWIISQSIDQIDHVTMGISETHNASTAIYLRMDANNIPYDASEDDWANYKLSPLASECLSIERNGISTNIGLVDTLQMIKFASSGYQYYLDLKPASTPIGALASGDILTIEGYWKYTSGGVSHLINISPAKFQYDGTKWDVYHETCEVMLGSASLGIGTNNATNIPLLFLNNALPVATYSLLSGAVLLNDVPVDATLSKNAETAYVLKLSSGASSGDILEINGTFRYRDPTTDIDYLSTISLSTFIFDGTSWQAAEFGGTY